MVEHRIVVPGVVGSSPITHPRPISPTMPNGRQDPLPRSCGAPCYSLPRSAPVAQLDRAPDFESVGRRFESYRARQFFSSKHRDPSLRTPLGSSRSDLYNHPRFPGRAAREREENRGKAHQSWIRRSGDHGQAYGPEPPEGGLCAHGAQPLASARRRACRRGRDPGGLRRGLCRGRGRRSHHAPGLSGLRSGHPRSGWGARGGHGGRRRRRHELHRAHRFPEDRESLPDPRASIFSTLP